MCRSRWGNGDVEGENTIILSVCLLKVRVTHQQSHLRSQHGSNSTEHGAQRQHGGAHAGGKYLGGKNVDDRERDGYGEFTDHEQGQL